MSRVQTQIAAAFAAIAITLVSVPTVVTLPSSQMALIDVPTLA